MSSTNESKTFEQMAHFTKATADLLSALGASLPSLDKDKIADQQRQNMEILTEVNRVASDLVKQVSQLQTHYIQNVFDDWQKLSKAATTPPSLQTMNDHMGSLRGQISRTMEHGSHIAGVLMKSNAEIVKTVQNRMSDIVSSYQPS